MRGQDTRVVFYPPKLNPCHPEQSSRIGEADAAAESKDPYPLPRRVRQLLEISKAARVQEGCVRVVSRNQYKLSSLLRNRF